MSENLESSIKSSTQELERINKKLLEEKGLLESLSRILGKNVKSARDVAEAFEAAADDMEYLEKATQRYGDAFAGVISKQRKEHRKLRDDMHEFSDLLEDMPKEFSDDFTKSITGIRQEFKRGLEDKLSETMVAIGEKLRKNIQLTANDIFTLKDQKAVLSRFNAISDEIDKLDDRTIGKGILAKGIEARHLGSSIKEGWQDRTGGGMRTAGKYLAEKGAASSGLGGMAMRGGGAVLSGAARAVPIVGGIVTAVSAVNDLVNAADNLVKGARNDYRAMAGPQFEGQKFADRSRQYNTAIRNAGRNRELGVDHNEWNSMFQTMNNAGMTVTTVEDKLGDLGTVMTSVRKTSLVMGLGLDTTSDIMANQYIEMKSGLDTMQDGLLAVSRGAKVAGIETSRFYQSVQQSTMSMAAYGNFTVAAATALEKLSVSSGNSQKDAEEGQASLTTMFKDMSAQDRLAFAGTMVKEMGSPEAFIKKYIADNEAKLKSTTNKDERQRLLKNVTAGQEALRAAPSDPLVAMSNLLGQMDPGQNADMLMQLVRKINGGNPNKSISEMLSGEGSLIEFGPAQQKNLELLRNTLVGYQSQLGSGHVGGATAVLNKHSQELATSGTAEQKSKYDEFLKTLRKGDKATDGELKTMSDYLTNTLGLTGDSLYGFQQILSIDMVSAGEQFTRAFEKNKKLVGEGKGATAATSESSIAEQMLRNYATAGRGRKGGSLTVQGQGEMLKALTPLEKMTQITKDSLLYQLADNELARTAVGVSMAIRDTVFGIFDKMTEEESVAPKRDLQRAQKVMDLSKIREDGNFESDMKESMKGLLDLSDAGTGDKVYIREKMNEALTGVKEGRLTPAQARAHVFGDQHVQEKLGIEGGIEAYTRNTLKNIDKLVEEGKLSNSVSGVQMDLKSRLAMMDEKRRQDNLKKAGVPSAGNPQKAVAPNVKSETNVFIQMDPNSGQSNANSNFRSYSLGQSLGQTVGLGVLIQ